MNIKEWDGIHGAAASVTKAVFHLNSTSSIFFKTMTSKIVRGLKNSKKTSDLPAP